MSAAEPAAAPPLVDAAYYSDGARWEASVYRSVLWSRNAWRLLAFLLAAGLAAAIVALVLLIPLKSFEVVTLLVDKTTGFVEVARPLEENGALTQRESVTRANVVRYIRARETYDPKGLRDNYDLAALYSTGTAARDLQDAFAASNPNNPMRTFGPDTKIAVFVRSVIFLNDRTAAVRFQTTRKNDRESETLDWVANVRFRYASAPMRNDWRFDNPLGFQVIEYRKDQETVSPAATNGQ